MTEPDATPDATDDTHYRRAFGEMCDSSVVSAQSAIYADNGTKLIEKGTRIDSELYARLVKHKLRDPIDQQIGIEGMVSLESLETMAREMAETSPLPRLLVAALGSAEPLLAPLRRVPLPSGVALKLTLMRDRYPGLLRLSLKTTLVALFLGARAGLAEAQLTALAAAGLLHDIGMLHMDPAWLAVHRTMSPAERRHLRAHPITAMLLVREQGGYPPEVATAVFEHHERLDGSGYPRGARAADISLLGQLLMLSELVAALASKFGDAAPHRLGMVLRLNQRCFPAGATGEILTLLRDAPLPSAGAAPADDAQRQFGQLAAAFEKWTELQPAQPTVGAGPAYAWMNARLAGLRQVLTEAGGHPDEPAYLLAYADDDARHLADADIVGREALWQLGSICRDALQRWPALTAIDAAAPHRAVGDVAAAAWCRWVQDTLPETVVAAPR